MYFVTYCLFQNSHKYFFLLNTVYDFLNIIYTKMDIDPNTIQIQSMRMEDKIQSPRFKSV